MALEPLIYLTIVLLVAVATLAARWLRAQMEKASLEERLPPPAAQPTGGAAQPVVPPGRPMRGATGRELPRPPSRAGTPEARPRPAPAAPARSRARRLRRTVRWMTILGRCRGLDPAGRVAEVGTNLDPSR